MEVGGAFIHHKNNTKVFDESNAMSTVKTDRSEWVC